MSWAHPSFRSCHVKCDTQKPCQSRSRVQEQIEAPILYLETLQHLDGHPGLSVLSCILTCRVTYPVVALLHGSATLLPTGLQPPMVAVWHV